MFKLIKFIFWCIATVTIAYFLTDFHLGDKTIKERIDALLHSPQGERARDNVREWVSDKVEPAIKKATETAIEVSKEKIMGPDDIRKKDEDKLKKILEENTDQPTKKEKP